MTLRKACPGLLSAEVAEQMHAESAELANLVY